jgi:hypothetical protein
MDSRCICHTSSMIVLRGTGRPGCRNKNSSSAYSFGLSSIDRPPRRTNVTSPN